MREIIVIANNIRSTHNVGSLLRTCDGLGVSEVYFTGYTPYPLSNHDGRMPHEAKKIDAQITKTALGAEKSVNWQHHEDIQELIKQLRSDDYTVAALEQTNDSTDLNKYHPPEKLVIVLGREVEGLEPDILEKCDLSLEIPMKGKKESFNVVQAAAMALYHCTLKPL